MLNVNVVIGVPISIFNDKSSVENIEKELKKWKQEIKKRMRKESDNERIAS